MSAYDHCYYNTPPPDYEEIVWVIRLTGDTDSLQEYFEHVYAFGVDVLGGSYSERDGTLVLRITTFKHEPEQIYSLFLHELDSWEEISVVSSKEET